MSAVVRLASRRPARPARFAPDPRRRAMIAKLQIAKKELGLDDDDYRAILLRLTGKRSSSDCDEGQLAAVLDELKAKGWTPTVPGVSKARPAAADHPVAKKARALWISLHQLGVVRNASDAALEAFARRQLRVERLQWADQSLGYKLVEALKAMADREGWSQETAGIDPAFVVLELKRRLAIAQQRRLYNAAPTAAFVDRVKTMGLEPVEALIHDQARRIWAQLGEVSD